MNLKVRLYGEFRELASENSRKIGIVDLEVSPEDKILDVLETLGVEPSEVSHIFLDGEYSSQKRKISDGERLAIFPRDMGLLYKWYFDPVE